MADTTKEHQLLEMFIEYESLPHMWWIGHISNPRLQKLISKWMATRVRKKLVRLHEYRKRRDAIRQLLAAKANT